MPAEWTNHSQTITVWPDFPSIEDADVLRKARSEVSAISNAIARFEPVTMFTRPKNLYEARQTVSQNVTVRPLNASELWVRDTGAIFVHGASNGCFAGLKLGFNLWGSKFEKDPTDSDETVAEDLIRSMATDHMDSKDKEWLAENSYTDDTTYQPVATEEVDYGTYWQRFRTNPSLDPGFISEGGALEVDGDGTLIATESSIINSNRNPSMTKAELEEKFKKYLGVEKTIWLAGIRGYDTTDYHIDAFARFIEPPNGLQGWERKTCSVLLSRPSKKADFKVIQAYEEAKEILMNETDRRGRQLHVIEVQEPHAQDLAGEHWGGTVASYVNYYLVNGGLIMPRFGVEELDEEAFKLFRQCCANREIVQVDLNTLPKLGGGIHCATQQVPEKPIYRGRGRV
ncbi:hypothetical protein F66182_4864 [Fusarium sp. NRRL 66182]|nr:hypothetical protein F66182_4864 [Fusarium sp. NRRL 66182]